MLPKPAIGPPPRKAVIGGTVRLEPLAPDAHGSDLYAVSTDDPDIWTYLSKGPFGSDREMRRWLEACAASRDPLFFAVVDAETGGAVGMVSFLRIEPEHGVIEIGHIWFSSLLRRTRAASEAIFLMLHLAFDDLGYRRVEWKCNAGNAASRRAAERFGFAYEGTFLQHLIVKGRNRDTAWYSIIDGEWPSVRAAFETWLAPANFDAKGRQHRPLSEMIREVRPGR